MTTLATARRDRLARDSAHEPASSSVDAGTDPYEPGAAGVSLGGAAAALTTDPTTDPTDDSVDPALLLVIETQREAGSVIGSTAGVASKGVVVGVAGGVAGPTGAAVEADPASVARSRGRRKAAPRIVSALTLDLAAVADVEGLAQEVALLRASIRRLAQPDAGTAEHVKVLAELRHQVEALCTALKTQQALEGNGDARAAELARVLDELGDQLGVPR
jgi:hypothetical protein